MKAASHAHHCSRSALTILRQLVLSSAFLGDPVVHRQCPLLAESVHAGSTFLLGVERSA